ncbi:hypothetical protein BDW69DRAFT_152413 [Aspergillus filifer]
MPWKSADWMDITSFLLVIANAVLQFLPCSEWMASCCPCLQSTHIPQAARDVENRIKEREEDLVRDEANKHNEEIKKLEDERTKLDAEKQKLEDNQRSLDNERRRFGAQIRELNETRANFSNALDRTEQLLEIRRTGLDESSERHNRIMRLRQMFVHGARRIRKPARSFGRRLRGRRA